MTDSRYDDTLEHVVLTRVMRLNATLHGIVLGLVAGAGLFVATIWLLIKGGPTSPEGAPIIGPNLSLLGQYFIGYDVTPLGSVIGFFYAFVVGFVVGYFIAFVYNLLVDLKEGYLTKKTG